MSASREKKQRKVLAAAQVDKPVDNSAAKAAKKAKRNKIVGIIIGVVIAVIVAAVIIFYSLSKTTFFQSHTTAVDVDGAKLSATDIGYYYWDAYYNFANQNSSFLQYFIQSGVPLDQQDCTLDPSKTWAEYFLDSAITSAEEIYTLCGEAKAAGFTLPEDQAAQIDAEISALKANVGGTDKAANSYLEQYYGAGSNIDSYRKYRTAVMTASAYYVEKFNSFTFSDDEIDAYYNEHISDFDVVDFRLFSLPYNDEEEEYDPDDGKLHLTKAQAQDIIETMADVCKGDEQQFLDMAWDNIAEATKQNMTDADGFTLQTNVTAASLPNEEVTAWLYDTSRVEGDTYVNEITGGFSIYYFKSRSALDYDTVNYRNILIPPQIASEVDPAVSGSTVTEGDWAVALTAAQAAISKWQDEMGGDEDGFAQAAEQFSSDVNTYPNGGLNENVSKVNLSEEMADWLYDDSRKSGDYSIIQTTNGYEVVYFIGYGKNYQDLRVENAMRSDSYSEWFEGVRKTAKRGAGIKYLETTHYATGA